MFPSFFRLLGVQSTNTQAFQSAFTNMYSQNFAEYAMASPNALIRTLGEITSAEPSAFVILLAGFIFCILLLVRWMRHLTSRGRHSSKSRHVRACKEILKFLFSWRTLVTLMLGTGIFLTSLLNTPQDIRHLLRIIMFSFMLYLLYRRVAWFTRLYFRSIDIYPRRRSSPKQRNLRLLAYRFFQVVWVVVFGTFFLGLWGMELGSILAGLGIAGIVAGLALQDAFSHLVGGVSLMLDETYSVGDIVKLENGTEGVIFEIGFRSTKIRTWDEEMVTVPNGILAKMVITNHSQPIERKRVRLEFQVDASTASPEQVKEILMQAVTRSAGVLSNPEPFITLKDIKGSMLTFRTAFYVESVLVKITISDEVLRTVLVLFEKNKIRLIPNESLLRISR